MSLRLLSLWGLWWSAGLGARVEGLWARGGPLTQLLGRAQGMCRRLCWRLCLVCFGSQGQ
jgi:hypothetical protein